MRKIKINKTAVNKESKNSIKKAFSYPETEAPKGSYFPSVESNVFGAAREAIKKGGKFYQMFAAGDGHELEDYTDEQGRFHLAHAKSLYSSSMLAYNFFHWICPEHPLTLNGIVFDKVYFEVKFPVLAKNADGSRNNRPSNMDVVLISNDCATMLCIESKYTEHTHNQAAKFSDAYFKPACYYQGNPYRTSFVQMALHYNEKNNGYYAGIKQNISHFIGLTNIMYDADAMAWFKANNPFIEPEVDIHNPHKEESEKLLKQCFFEHLSKLPDSAKVIFKLTIPTVPDFYQDLMKEKHVVFDVKCTLDRKLVDGRL